MAIRDIGSIYPLYNDSYGKLPSNIIAVNFFRDKVLYSLCREALSSIAILHKKNVHNKVMIPAYTCHVVYDSFEKNGWESYFYNVEENLRMDVSDIRRIFYSEKPSLLVAHPYYGMDFNEQEQDVLRELSEHGCIIIVDLTQNIFSSQRMPFVDYYVGSIRKWMNIPDGGFLESNKHENQNFKFIETQENVDFVCKQKDAMYLRGVYYKTEDSIIKSVSIHLNKEAEFLNTNNIHKISSFSENILLAQDIDEIKSKRLLNFQILYKGIRETCNIKKAVKSISELTTAPLYFPLFVKQRKEFQKYLANQDIYCPILWSNVPKGILLSESVRFIYNHILVIPIDQRYGDNEMKRVVNVINNYIS